jgi:hypothetical protein
MPLKSYGCHYRALAAGRLQPFHETQTHFIAVARRLAAPQNPAETAGLKFKADYPELAASEAGIQSAADQGGVSEVRSSAKNQTEACKDTEFTASQIQ